MSPVGSSRHSSIGSNAIVKHIDRSNGANGASDITPDEIMNHKLETFARLVSMLWTGNEALGSSHDFASVLVSLLVSKSLCLTVEQISGINMSDLLVFPLQNKVNCLIVKSSTVQHPFLYHGCVRARTVQECPHASVAAYLFSKFHLNNGLDITNRTEITDFYESKLLHQKSDLNQCFKSIIKVSEIDPTEFTDDVTKFTKIHNLKSNLPITDIPCSTSLANLPEDVIYKYAGFHNGAEYRLERDLEEPPVELVNQIFPFINEENNAIFDILTVRMVHVLSMLRRSFVQDMVLIRKSNPSSSISRHPIFNSELFNRFADKLEAKMGIKSINQSMNPSINHSPASIPHPTPPLPQQLNPQDQIHHLQGQMDFFIKQQADIYTGIQTFLHNQNDLYHRQLSALNQGPQALAEPLSKEKLTDTLNMVSNLMVQQQQFFSITGPSPPLPLPSPSHYQPSPPKPILSAPSSAASIPTTLPPSIASNSPKEEETTLPPLPQHQQQHPQHPLHRASSHTSPHPGLVFHSPPVSQPPLQHQHIHHHQQMPQQIQQQILPPPPPYGPGITPMAPGMAMFPPLGMPPQLAAGQLPHVPPGHMMGQMPITGQYGMIPTHNPLHSNAMMTSTPQLHHSHPQQQGIETDVSYGRRKALNRRLSRQAINIYEMWDDFKSLEKGLEENEISITEWLKLHGSSERQFRHTRQKIIRFIDEESARTNTPVEVVKDKLHNKMRNRVKPWTLDEVQRMLTSGKRINLD